MPYVPGLQHQQPMLSGGDDIDIGEWFVCRYRHIGHGQVSDDGIPLLRCMCKLIVRVTDKPGPGIAFGDCSFIHKGKFGEKSWQQSGFHGHATIKRHREAWVLSCATFSWLGQHGFKRQVSFLPLDFVLDSPMYGNVCLGFHEERAWCATYYTRARSCDSAWKRDTVALPCSSEVGNYELYRSRL